MIDYRICIGAFVGTLAARALLAGMSVVRALHVQAVTDWSGERFKMWGVLIGDGGGQYSGAWLYFGTLTLGVAIPNACRCSFGFRVENIVYKKCRTGTLQAFFWRWNKWWLLYDRGEEKFFAR